MWLVLAALLSLAALIYVLATNAKDNDTIHIGGRTPPTETGCNQVGMQKNDEGKLLGIYSCPA